MVSPGVPAAPAGQGLLQVPGVLSVDRYLVPGGTVPQDMVVGVRDMSGPARRPGQLGQHPPRLHPRLRVRRRCRQRHGRATATRPSPRATSRRRGGLGVFQPRVYFGQQETSYAIVGGRGQRELDYPNARARAARTTTPTRRRRRAGRLDAGPAPVRDQVPAAEHPAVGAIDSNSQILYNRDPLARVAKVAPFLTLDSDTYPVVAAARSDWVVDGYTTTDNYPYSAAAEPAAGHARTATARGGSVDGAGGQINYIRNSVKAVVNAYTGQVSLYQWGGNDPVLDAWMKAFPGVVKPQQRDPGLPGAAPALPAGCVRGAAADPGPVPRDPGAGVLRRAELLVRADGPERHQPERRHPAAVLPDHDHARPAPAGILADHHVHPARAGEHGGVHGGRQQPAERGYGQIRVLQLPQDTAIRGPQQVQADFESDPPSPRR